MRNSGEDLLEEPPDSQLPDFDWAALGEVPSTDPDWLVEPTREHFIRSANNLATGLKADHEVATRVDNRFVSVIKDHKKEIEIAATTVVAGLAVFGVLAATKQLRLRKKS